MFFVSILSIHQPTAFAKQNE